MTRAQQVWDKKIKPRMLKELEQSIRAPKPLALQKNTGPYTHRLLIGTPTLGVVRMEWHNAMGGLVIPCNWSNSASTPLGFLVADAQNLLARDAIAGGFSWLLLIEDDVIVPPDLFLKLAPYVRDSTVPLVSGLYHLKGSNEPLLYRGRGNGAYRDFTPGKKVWVDGVPTGCLLIHTSILKALAQTAESYTLRVNGEVHKLLRIFQTPRSAWLDSGTGAYQKLIGTSDLFFCDQILTEQVLVKAGWKALAKKPFPFLVDTAIRCGHIDRATGIIT